MKATASIAVTAAFIAGLAAGLLLRRGAEAASPPPREGRSPSAPGATTDGGPVATPLSTTIERQRERIRQLEERIFELELRSPGIKSKKEKLAIASDIFEEFLRLGRGGSDSESLVQAFSRLGELDDTTASYFIQKMRAHTAESPYDATLPLVLALASGGPEVASLILNTLQDTATPPSERRRLLGSLAGDEGFYSVNRVPVGPELARMAQQLISSSDTLERRAGASLLGGADGAMSRPVLHQLALLDRDVDVRASALRALGYAGDQATLDLLENYPPPPQGTSVWDVERVEQALDTARRRLRKKFAK